MTFDRKASTLKFVRVEKGSNEFIKGVRTRKQSGALFAKTGAKKSLPAIVA